jgi:hypothetical protein
MTADLNTKATEKLRLDVEFKLKIITVFLLKISSQLFDESRRENGGAFNDCAAFFDFQADKTTKSGNDAQISTGLGFSKAFDDTLDSAAMQAAIAVHASFEKLASGSVGVFADFHRSSGAVGK